MVSFEPEAYPQPTDVANMYRLALGRDPEAESIVQERLGQPNREWVPGFFKSSEFAQKVYNKIVAGDEIDGGLFDRPPSPELVIWAATFFSSTKEHGEKVIGASSWYALFHSLFSDPGFAQHALGDAIGQDRSVLLDRLSKKHALAVARAIDSGIESLVAGELVGWALDRHEPDRRLLIQLYVEDVFVMAASTAEYREDLRSRFGSGGWHGFRLRYDLAGCSSGGPLRAVLKEAGTKAVIATFTLPDANVAANEALAIQRTIVEVKELLERVEARLPALSYGLTVPLAAYDDYFKRYYTAEPSPARMLERELGPCAVLINATCHTPRQIERLLRSLDAQSLIPDEVVMLHVPGPAGIEASFCLEAWRQGLAREVRVVAVEVDEPNEELLALTVQTLRAEHVLWCPAHHWFQPDAVALLSHALADGGQLVYGDSDVVLYDRLGREVHADPQLRTDFDYDLLLQQDYLDCPIAANRALFVGDTIKHGGGINLPLALALRLHEQGRYSAIRHVSRVLSHADRTPTTEHSGEHRQIVERHFARAGISACIEDRSDPVGAVVPGALRVRRPANRRARVAIVVPTRDRRDLLEPCLTSILLSQPHNLVQTEIIVVDNQSCEEETTRYLEQLIMLGQARVLAHDGPFNWALMNNRAAAATDADVLVFLNNDTAVLTADCWDEISSNVLRPEIGALGARLLYADGKIQHAGAVLDGWTSFSRHEGMGRPAQDPGYLGRHALLRRVSTVTGACLATRAELFQEMGGFDAASLPVEGNDTDYCLRLTDRGYVVLYDPYVTFYHFESKSRGYNLDDSSRLLADEAGHILRTRWPDRVGNDPFYNTHFDPLSAPGERLRPPSDARR